MLKGLKNNKLIGNVASLGIIQIVNYVFPLITVPYISRIIGPDGYGIINYATAFIGYFALIIAYGFDLTATRKISHNTENLKLINNVISEVITSRIILFLVSLILFLVSLILFKPIQKDVYVAIILFVGCISTVISPQYIFQGFQELKIFAVLNFIKGVLNTLLVFVLIKEQSDYYWIPTLTTFFSIAISIYLYYYSKKKFNIKYKLVSLKTAINLIISEKTIFFSTVVISLYTTTNTVILGFFADIKSFLKNKDFKVLASNFFNLALIQGLDMVLPLLVIPYTTRVLGFEKLGLIAFAGAVVAYFGIFISYGFNLTATKQVSKNREDNYLLKKIYSQVTLSKLFLILISSIIFFVGIIFIPKFSEHKTLFLISFLSIIFTNLVPYWFFQGIQDLKYTTLLTTIFKVLSTAAIFTFVQKEEDYLIIALLPLISNFIIFTIIQIILYKKYKISLIKITKKDIQTQLHDGFYVFLSQVKITFFTNFNTIVIGSVLGDAAVGLFSSAEKIIRMLSLVQVPIVSSLFPYFSKKLHESRQEGFLQINKIAKVGSVIYIVVCLAVFFLARYIAVWVFGSQIDEISTLIRIMVFIPIFVFANNLYGTQFLLNIGKDKRFTANLLFAAILNVCMVIPLTYFFKVNGTAVSVLLTEIFVFVIMYYSAIKNKKNIELK